MDLKAMKETGKMECYQEAIEDTIHLIMSNIKAKKTLKNFSKLSFCLSSSKIEMKASQLQLMWNDHQDSIRPLQREFEECKEKSPKDYSRYNQFATFLDISIDSYSNSIDVNPFTSLRHLR